MITRYPENKNLFTDHREGTHHISKADPTVVYFAELIEGPVPSWMVVYQKEGYPGTEAHDDWFGRFHDADALAKEMAEAPEATIVL